MKSISHKKIVLSTLFAITAVFTPLTQAKLIIGKAQMNNAMQRFAKSAAEGIANSALKNIDNLSEESIRRIARIAMEQILNYSECDTIEEIMDNAAEKAKEILTNKNTKDVAKELAQTIVEEISKHPKLTDNLIEKLEKITQSKTIQEFVKDIEYRIAKEMTKQAIKNLNGPEGRKLMADVAQTILGTLLIFSGTYGQNGTLCKFGCLAAGIPLFYRGIKDGVAKKAASIA